MEESKPIQNLETANTQDRILKQAMRLFLEKGYHGTSIDEITRAAGITKGALYWHFESKEDLLKKITEEFENRFLNEMIHAVREVKGGALDKLEKYVRFNSAFAYYNRELCVSFTTLAAELVGAHHEIEPKIRQIYTKYQKFLADLISHGKREKIFRNQIDSNLAALAIIAFHDGILLQWSMNRNEVDGEAFVKSFRNVLLKGLCIS